MKKLCKFIALTALFLGLTTSIGQAKVIWSFDVDFKGHDILNVGNIDSSTSTTSSLDLESTTEPSAPTAGDVRVWAADSTTHFKTNEAKSTLSLDPTDGGLGIVRTEDELNLVSNAYYDEASGNWYRIDESKYSMRIKLYTNATKMEVLYASPGSGAITWSVGMNLFGAVLYGSYIKYIVTESQNTEPDIDINSVTLWEDTDDNRWWLIWDKGGTQYKVGFENSSGELQWTPVYQEQRAHVTQFYAPASNNPDQGEIGVTPVLLFSASSDEWVYYEWEVPENYYTGSNIKIRFYWAPTDGNTGDVVWGIEYMLMNSYSQISLPSQERVFSLEISFQ